MGFCLVHLDDEPAPPGCDEEVYVVVPGAAKTAIAIPLDALALFLPMLEQAVDRAVRPQCSGCGAPLGDLARFVCARAHCEPADPG